MIGAMIRQGSNSEHFDPAQNDADDSRSGGIQQYWHQQDRLLAENAELPVRFVHWNAETGQESGI